MLTIVEQTLRVKVTPGAYLIFINSSLTLNILCIAKTGEVFKKNLGSIFCFFLSLRKRSVIYPASRNVT